MQVLEKKSMHLGADGEGEGVELQTGGGQQQGGGGAVVAGVNSGGVFNL